MPKLVEFKEFGSPILTIFFIKISRSSAVELPDSKEFGTLIFFLLASLGAELPGSSPADVSKVIH